MHFQWFAYWPIDLFIHVHIKVWLVLEIYYWFLYILIAASILIKIGALSQILILSAHCTSNKFSLNIAKIYFYFSRCDNYKLPWRMSVVYCLYELGIISCSTITVWENTCIMIKKVYLVLINKHIFLYSSLSKLFILSRESLSFVNMLQFKIWVYVC